MKKQRRGHNRYVLQDGRDPKTVKQHHWKCEAKEEHQLSPGGLATDESSGPNQLK